MRDETKIKKQLVDELREVRQRVAQLEASVAEFKQVEEALRESEAKYHDLYDNAPDMYVSVDAKTAKILDCNQTLSTALGYTKEEFIGHPIYWVYHPDCMEDVKKAFQSFVETGEVNGAELQLKRKDGSKIDVMLSVSAVRDEHGNVLYSRSAWRDITELKQAQEKLKAYSENLEMMGEDRTKELRDAQVELMRDITERKQTEQKLEDSYRKFQQLYDEAPVGYHEIDSDGRITQVNVTELNMLGYTHEEIVGRPVWEFIVEKETSRKAFRDKITGVKPLAHSFERSYRRKDGTIFPVLIKDRPIKDENGNIIGLRSTIQDITNRKKAEEEIRRLNEDLGQRVKERTAELEVANEELESFAYSVSHDLRAPLRAIDGFSQILLEDYDDKLDAQGKDYLQRMDKGAKHMAQLTDDLLELSRVTRREMKREAVDLSTLAKEIAAELEKGQPVRQVEFIIPKGLVTKGDLHLLRVVLENLMGNAWKFSGKQPNARIEFGVERVNGELEYFVRDNGVGFDMAYADKLFTPFQRLHGETEFEGTGIGLASIKRIILRHRGRVWAESKEGSGATFFFTLQQQKEE